jgi:phosphatidylserine/phosphatidylglycerophosphate/cardiolipin synthase-like enzyme
VAEGTREDLLRRIVELGRTMPPGILETICTELEAIAPGGHYHKILGKIPNPDVRSALAVLLASWKAADATESFVPLAWALRGAGSTDQWLRENERLAIVWTGPTTSSGGFRRTDQALLQVIAAAKKDLWLVSFAGYKLPAVATALATAAERDVAVHMIIESPEQSQGKVTFSVLEGLGQRLAEVATVYVWPLHKREKNAKGDHGSLHVKCALADDAHLLVSSANLTEFAMSLNMELGLLVRGGDMPREVGRHFRWLIEQGHLVPTPRG